MDWVIVKLQIDHNEMGSVLNTVPGGQKVFLKRKKRQIHKIVAKTPFISASSIASEVASTSNTTFSMHVRNVN